MGSKMGLKAVSMDLDNTARLRAQLGTVPIPMREVVTLQEYWRLLESGEIEEDQNSVDTGDDGPVELEETVRMSAPPTGTPRYPVRLIRNDRRDLKMSPKASLMTGPRAERLICIGDFGV